MPRGTGITQFICLIFFSHNYLITLGFWFSVLLNLKHIYLYCAVSYAHKFRLSARETQGLTKDSLFQPVYFFYLLKHYCINTGGSKFEPLKSFLRLAKLGTVVVAVFAASFGPFLYLNQGRDSPIFKNYS
jgi:hypothetical protein